MCGQCGLILERPGPVGHLLRVMEGAMLHRGPDSTGFALYGEEPHEQRIVVRARIDDGAGADRVLAQVADRVTSAHGQVTGEPDIRLGLGGDAAFCRLLVSFDGPPAVLLAAIEGVEGVYVHSMGRRLEIIKDVGTAEEVAARHGVDQFIGTHGLAHSRLATEEQALRQVFDSELITNYVREGAVTVWDAVLTGRTAVGAHSEAQ